MFVQIIEGPVSDAEQLRRQMERWRDDIRPGASGFLGSTAGLTPDGTGVVIARFESEDAARSNAARPEQDAWWAETEKCFEREPTFAESSDVAEMLGGGSDQAGFVQVMKGRADDRGEVERMDRLFAEHAPTWRPDVIGGLRVWVGATDYVEIVYFTSEAEARRNEQTEPPAELAADMQNGVPTGTISYLDLPEPLLVS
jgi:hypothetical protein